MKKTLEIRGMTCEHCVKRVNKIISGCDGVSDVSVDLQKMEAAFECDPHHTDIGSIVKAINEFGYTALEKE
jgi:copper ion binding protein